MSAHSTVTLVLVKLKELEQSQMTPQDLNDYPKNSKPISGPK